MFCSEIKFLPRRVAADEVGDEVLQGVDSASCVKLICFGEQVVNLFGNDFKLGVAGARNADFFVVSLRGGFVVGEHFFEEFFARTESCVDDFDVLVGLEAGEEDHAACQVGNFDGFAHIKDEDVPTVAHCGGLQD
jgi:hypothetical protein